MGETEHSKRMAIAAQPDREKLQGDLAKPIIEALDAKKLDENRAACLIDQAARAKRYTHHKIRGGINGDLPRGYKKVAEGIGNLEDETLVVHSEPDHTQRLKAADQIVKLRGSAPEKQASGIFGGATIIVQSAIPDPDVIDADDYPLLEEEDEY